jgi:hypothetical protein
MFGVVLPALSVAVHETVFFPTLPVAIVPHEDEAIPESASVSPVGVTAGAGAPSANTLPAVSEDMNVGAVTSSPIDAVTGPLEPPALVALHESRRQ